MTHTPDLCPLGALIEDRLRMLRMNRRDAAPQIGMPLASLTMLLTGEASPSVRTLLRMEALLGVPAEDLAALDARRRLDAARAELEAAR